MAWNLDRALGGKALGPHPAFLSSDPISTYSPGNPREDAVVSQREAERHTSAYGGSQAIDHVYDCIGLYTDPVATAPYHLEKPDGTQLVRQKGKGTPPDHEVGPAAAYAILDKPNRYMLYGELMSLFVIDIMLVGNAYWYKLPTGDPAKPYDLYRLAPSYVKIKPGKLGPKSYEYQPPGAREKLILQPEDVIHFRRANPHSNFYGLGVIQGSGRAMDLELAITSTMSHYYGNKADPSLIIQSERRVSRDVFNKLRAQLRARTAGSSRAGELLVLEAGLKASTLSASASDALFDKLSVMSRDRVYTKFHVSPLLFGILDSAGQNKVSDMRREFDNYTLRPFMTNLANQVTAGLMAEFDVVFKIDHRSILPADEATKVGESLGKLPGVKIREVRRAYAQFGIDESTGDPEVDELIINLPGENMDEDGQGVNGGDGLADKPLAGEPGRPPKPENTAAIGHGSPGGATAQGKALTGDRAGLTDLSGFRRPKLRDPIPPRRQRSFDEIRADFALRSVEEAIAARGKAVSTPAPDNRLPGEQRPADTFATARQTDIDNVTRSTTAALRAATVDLERALLDHVEGKALKTSDLVSRVRKSPAWKAFQKRVEAILDEAARDAAASGFMHSGLTPDDEVDYDALVKSVLYRPNGGVKSVVNTLRDRVVGKIKDTRAADGERHEFENAVRVTLAEWADGQAPTIADSEATEAYNEGTLTAAELSGVTQVYVTDGDDSDEPCQQANGQVWDLTKARENRKEHPNCRRAFIPLTVSEVA